MFASRRKRVWIGEIRWGRRVVRFKRKHVLGLLLATATVAAALWAAWPWLVVASLGLVEKKGEEPMRAACDRIVRVGPRVVPAVISAIRSNSPWVRRYCGLPFVLRELGPPAHEALLRAVDEERDLRKRAYLTSALHTGFSDFSRTDRVVDDMAAGRLSAFAITHIGGDFKRAYPEAPPLVVDDKAGHASVNPEFLEWWRKRRA